MSGWRSVVFVLIGWGALFIESSLAALMPAWHRLLATPELSLFVVLYLGLSGRGGAPGLCAVALCIGYLRDLYLGAPRGVEALAFCVVALCARAMHGRVFVERWVQLAAIACGVTLLHAAMVGLFGAEAAGASFGAALRPLPSLLVGAACIAPLVIRVLRRVDQRLAPETPSLDLSHAWR